MRVAAASGANLAKANSRRRRQLQFNQMDSFQARRLQAPPPTKRVRFQFRSSLEWPHFVAAASCLPPLSAKTATSLPALVATRQVGQCAGGRSRGDKCRPIGAAKVAPLIDVRPAGRPARQPAKCWPMQVRRASNQGSQGEWSRRCRCARKPAASICRALQLGAVCVREPPAAALAVASGPNLIGGAHLLLKGYRFHQRKQQRPRRRRPMSDSSEKEEAAAAAARCTICSKQVASARGVILAEHLSLSTLAKYVARQIMRA